MSTSVELKKFKVKGRNITYRLLLDDFHTVRFTFWQRIKILLGKPLIMEHYLFVLNKDIKVSASDTQFTIEPLFGKPNHPIYQGKIEDKKQEEQLKPE